MCGIIEAMAQGTAFTKEQRKTIIETVIPYLEMGFSRNKACAFVGLHPTTLSKWVQADEALSMKLVSAENTMSALALANMYQALQNENEVLGKGKEVKADNSKWFLNVKEDGYKPKQDITTNGESINPEQVEAANVAIDDYLANHQGGQSD